MRILYKTITIAAESNSRPNHILLIFKNAFGSGSFDKTSLLIGMNPYRSEVKGIEE